MFSQLNKRVKDIESRVTKNATPTLENRLTVAKELWTGEVRLFDDGAVVVGAGGGVAALLLPLMHPLVLVVPLCAGVVIDKSRRVMSGPALLGEAL